MSFPLPQPVNAGHGSEYGPPVMPVQDWYPGVEVVQAVQDHPRAASVNVVHEMGPGVRPVYFDGGLPMHLDPTAQIRQQAEQAQAYLAAQDQRGTEVQVAQQQAARRAVMLLTIL